MGPPGPHRPILAGYFDDFESVAELGEWTHGPAVAAGGPPLLISDCAAAVRRGPELQSKVGSSTAPFPAR